MILGRTKIRYLHVKEANPALVGPDAGNIVLELGWEVRAYSVVETVVGTVTAESGVGADEDVAISLGSTSLELKKPDGQHENVGIEG